MGCTRQLAEHVSKCEYSDIPLEVCSRSKTLIRDLLGVALYGSQQPIGDSIDSYVSLTAPGDCGTVIGRGSASPTGAALANGTFAHAVDYDDTFESLVLHPSAPVFPAALAASEHADATGRDLLVGYITGVDIPYRIGLAVFPSHYDHGWHATGTVGAFGAAGAAASVLGLSVEESERAFGIVASLSSTLLKNAGSMTKPLHAGHAAEMGVRAAFLASEGFTANHEIIEGSRGYGNLMTPDGSFERVGTEALGVKWAVSDIGIKPYPSGRITHAGLEALRNIMRRENLDASDVARVRVTLDAAARNILTYEEPDNRFEAKASIEFPHAAVLREGHAGVPAFTDEYVTAPETHRQMDKIERSFQENLFNDGYGSYGARVLVETIDGREFKATEREAIGSPTNPLSRRRLHRKFEECASEVLEEAGRDSLTAAVEGLPRADDVGALCDALVPRDSVDSDV